MFILRILTLPIALFTFAGLYSISIKAPAAVEFVSLALCMILPLVLIAKLLRRLV